MPQKHIPLPSALRNRNRLTNKSRIKIVYGSLDDDIIEPYNPDLAAATAGIDQEDAQEHHLLAVLSAASQRNSASSQRPTRGNAGADKTESAPAAFIPTPDSTGIVANYEELYPPGRWTDPATYIRTSDTVEECIANALADGFTYYMDERDKEWFDKNNEEARGEGTSAQGAVSASGTGTRGSSTRSAKSKGKDPETAPPVVMSEDEFELVMGLFEKVTHEKTEYLHHSLETGMAFPAYSDYQDTFMSDLRPPMFAAFTRPAWIPAPVHLARIARVVYPYWKQRRLERGGHRIIPTLNGDETDTLNESYICFRRREIKATRKTRAQATSSDKLIRLQQELSLALDLAKTVFVRETVKKETAQDGQSVWEKRLALVEIKKTLPGMGEKVDDELLFDKERVPKRPKVESRLPLKLRPHNDQNTPVLDVAIKPKERLALIQAKIENDMMRQKESDHHWEDHVDYPYQNPLVPYASRCFKYISPPGISPPPSSSSSSSASSSSSPIASPPGEREQISEPRAVRVRIGRGGRRIIDRRPAHPHKLGRPDTLRNPGVDDDSVSDTERRARLLERWRYDLDDEPAIGPHGSEEQDRVLIDDYDPQYLYHNMSLFRESDLQSLMNDPTLIVASADGRHQPIIPFRLGPHQIRAPPRVYASGGQAMISQVAQHLQQQQQQQLQQHHQQQQQAGGMAPNSGTPISMQTQMKKMNPPMVPQMRISANGGMRPPSVASMQHSSPPHSSPPHAHAQQPILNNANGVTRGAINMPHVDVKAEIHSNSPMNSNGVVPSHSVDNVSLAANDMNAPTRPKSQNQHHLVPNTGYPHATMLNGFPVSSNVQYPHPQPHHANPTLSIQQMQNLKTAFANMVPGQDLHPLQNINALGRIPTSYSMHVSPNSSAANANFNLQLAAAQAGSNMTLKLPTTRQMQWTTSPNNNINNGNNNMQRVPSVNGVGVGVGGMDCSMASSPSSVHTIPAPVRTPSTNGIRGGQGQVQHSMSPLLQHSPSAAQSQSSPMIMTMPSPSLQHQQQAVSSQGGY